jgi:hypothetical protein
MYPQIIDLHEKVACNTSFLSIIKEWYGEDLYAMPAGYVRNVIEHSDDFSSGRREIRLVSRELIFSEVQSDSGLPAALCALAMEFAYGEVIVSNNMDMRPVSLSRVDIIIPRPTFDQYILFEEKVMDMPVSTGLSFIDKHLGFLTTSWKKDVCEVLTVCRELANQCQVHFDVDSWCEVTAKQTERFCATEGTINIADDCSARRDTARFMGYWAQSRMQSTGTLSSVGEYGAVSRDRNFQSTPPISEDRAMGGPISQAIVMRIMQKC